MLKKEKNPIAGATEQEIDEALKPLEEQKPEAETQKEGRAVVQKIRALEAARQEIRNNFSIADPDKVKFIKALEESITEDLEDDNIDPEKFERRVKDFISAEEHKYLL